MAGSKVMRPLLAMMCVELSLPMLATGQTAAQHEGKKAPDLYDRNADGEEQIKQGLAVAQRDNKRVLVMFGANWCTWCHRMHALFAEHPLIARKILYEYEVVLVDVDTVDEKKHNQKTNERFGNPITHGLPVFVVLDHAGKQLVTQETASFEQGPEYVPERILQFLDKWKAEPLSADRVLAAGLEQAQKESKQVFLYFTAPWCTWCRKMDDFLKRPHIANTLNAAFVPVKIDVDRMTGGKELDARYRGGEEGGIPFFVVLDGKGNKLADAFGVNEKGTKANVGFPAADWEVAHFLTVLKTTAPQLGEGQLEQIRSTLQPK